MTDRQCIDRPLPGSRPIPAATRQAVKGRAAGVCEDCGAAASIELHHLHYETVGTECEADLAALCRACHRGRHVDASGDWWNDPRDMECHWWTYWEQMERG